MQSTLNYQPKIDYYKLFYVSLMVITKQKPTVDSQKIKRKLKHNHYGKSSHKGRQKERKKVTKGLQNSQKTKRWH